MDEYSREPCPWRIFDDAGGAFCMGALGGGIFHFVKGVRNSPRGLMNRFYEGSCYVRARAPISGGAFAMWGFTFSSIDCTMVAIRRKEDPVNSIFSGFATGFILAVRSGIPAAMVQGVVGGVILALIEGMMFKMNQWQSEQYKPIHVLKQEDFMKEQMRRQEEEANMTFMEHARAWWNNTQAGETSPGGPVPQ